MCDAKLQTLGTYCICYAVLYTLVETYSSKLFKENNISLVYKVTGPIDNVPKLS